MAEDKNYFGEKLRLAERAREDAYFRQLDQALNELPRSKLRGIKPPLARSYGPPVWRGNTGSCVHSLEQPQLDVLAMQLRIGFFTALLPDICAHDFFIPMTTYGTNEIPLGPKFATP